jgi:hypothetical protein
MRRRSFLLGLALATRGSLAGQTAGGLVRVEAGITPLRLVRGQEGKVLLKVVVKSGLSVSPHPSFTIEFEPSEILVFPKPFFSATDLDAEVVTIDGRQVLNFKKPLQVPFTVAARAPRGVHVLKGKVGFYAVSRAEGWCRKGTAHFRATYSTRTALVSPDIQIQP